MGTLAEPLSLTEAVDTALRRSPALRGAKETARAAFARAQAASSPWLPQLSATSLVRGDYSDQTGLSPMDMAQPGVGSMRYSGQVQLNQLIYDFGRTSGRIAAAQAGARASFSDAHAASAQAALSAISGFFAVQRAEALREVGQRNVEQQRQRLTQAESFFRIGTRPEIDVLIARTAVANAELQLVQADNGIWVARAQLLETLGLDSADWPVWLNRPLLPPEETPLDIETAELFFAPEQAVESLLEEALRRRPEYRAARERVQQAAAQLKATRADFFPLLSISGSASLAGSLLGGGTSSVTVGATGTIPSSSSSSPTLGLSGVLSLSWPLLSGLSTVYTLREMRAQLAAAEASLDALKLALRSQLLVALYQVKTAQRSLTATQALVAQAAKQLEMARGRYQNGVGNAIELGDAEVAAVSAQSERVQAMSALGIAGATLRWHLGLLVQTEAMGSGS